MKKLLIGLTVVVFVMCSALSVFANPSKFGGPNNHPGPGDRRNGFGERRNDDLRNDSRYILHRTADVISEAQRSAERGHKSFGLARAVFTQQRARDLYMKGNYQDAIFFSMRARNLAFDVIRANRERIRPEFFPDRLESRYDHQGPSDNDLDRQMDSDRGRMGRDDDAIHIKIEFNL